MPTENQVRRPTIVENELPAYSAVDESGYLIAERSVSAEMPPYRDPTPSPSLAAAATVYPTAEEEKAQLRASFMSASAAATVVDGDSHAHRDAFPTNSDFNSTPPPPSPQQPLDGSNLGGQNVPATVLSRGLQVPSVSRFASSGFPYPDILASYGISRVDWALFTSEITQAAQMKAGDWALAIGGGAGTFLVAGMVIAWWGVIPAYFVGRSIHRKREKENLARARDTGLLEQKLLKWNQDYFAPKGVLIRLDLPGESHGIGNMDVHTEKCSHCCQKKRQNGGAGKACGLVNEKKAAKIQVKMERKMEKESRKACKKEGKMKRKAVKKGRIVILPLNKDGIFISPATTATVVVPDIGGLSVNEKLESDFPQKSPLALQQSQLDHDQNSAASNLVVHSRNDANGNLALMQRKKIMHSKRNNVDRETRRQQLDRMIGTWNSILACLRTKLGPAFPSQTPWTPEDEKFYKMLWAECVRQQGLSEGELAVMVKRLKWLSPEQRTSIDVKPERVDEDANEPPGKSRSNSSMNVQRWLNVLGRAFGGSRMPLVSPGLGALRPVWLKI
ncbi:MAG: hypothetical protein M1816_007301 [Peltula sp. TS41687]|nr:MAG: hypothetical protein M1816_007301 [Peltula sp. TS41687]